MGEKPPAEIPAAEALDSGVVRFIDALMAGECPIEKEIRVQEGNLRSVVGSGEPYEQRVEGRIEGLNLANGHYQHLRTEWEVLIEDWKSVTRALAESNPLIYEPLTLNGPKVWHCVHCRNVMADGDFHAEGCAWSKAHRWAARSSV